MCSIAYRSTQIINHSSAPDLLTQHKSSITQVLQIFPLDTKHLINHVLQGPHPTQTSIYIYISSIIGLYPIYKTKNHVHMQWGLQPIIKIKHQDNHHNQ